MNEKQINKWLRKRFSPVGWTLVGYYVLMNILVSVAMLRDVIAGYLNAFIEGNDQYVPDVSTLTGNAWGYIAAVAVVTLDGDGKALPLDEWSTFGEWADDPVGSKIVASVYAEGEAGNLPQLPDNDMMRMFLKSMPINSMPMLMSDGGKAITAFMLDEYAKIAETAE